MDIISKAAGCNIVSRCFALPPVYPNPTTVVAYVEIYWRARNADDPASAWKLADVISPTGVIEVEYDPATDKNVEVAPMPYSASGTPSYASIDDAFASIGQTLTHQRETLAPTVTQASAATNDTITLVVTGYSPYAVRRKVRVADNSGMTTNLTEEITTADANGLPSAVVLNRTDGGTGTKTIYVRVSHSSSHAGAFGAESPAQGVTFANSGGTGGTTGDGDPYGRQQYNL
jgi:hypothetical protein